MRPLGNRQSLSELQREWYEKLKQDGFIDIEDSSDPSGQLKEWHSFKFISLSSQIRKTKRSQYQLQIDSFANDPSFVEVTILMTKHWNSRFKALDVELIWTLHRDGLTERGIASEMKCSKSCIHFLLERMREWMSLV